MNYYIIIIVLPGAIIGETFGAMGASAPAAGAWGLLHLC
jgi:hypothetical protein